MSKLLSDNNLALVQEYIDQHPPEMYFDYRDSLTDEQVAYILEGDTDRVYQDIEENSQEYIWEEEKGVIRNALEHFDLLPSDDPDDFVIELYHEGHLEMPPIDMNLGQLVRNTWANIAVQLPVEHDAYWREYEDVEDELEWWGLNPAEVRAFFDEEFDGPWPDIQGRVPRIAIRDLVEAWVNCAGCSGYWYALLDGHDFLDDMVSNRLDGQLVLKAGANCIVYSYWNGGGSTHEPTIADIPVEMDWISLDSGHYGIQSCYGFTDRAWNGQIVKAES